MVFRPGSCAARVAAIILPLLSLAVLSYGQNDNNQGNEGDYPVVSVSQGGIRPHIWVHKKIGPSAGQPASGILNPTQLTTAYGMNTVPGLGKGATIAIVDAYDAP